MANNRDPKQRQPGEKEPGKYHYNPGNQSGKPVDKGASEPKNSIDRKQTGGEPQDRKC